MLLPVLLLLAASPRVLVVTEWGENPKWKGSVLTPIACTTPDAGLSGSPNCLADAPATAEVTMLNGTTQKTVGKKEAALGLPYCGDDGASCKKRPLWVRAPVKKAKPAKKAAEPEPEEYEEPAPLTAAELKAEIGFWPKDLANFPLTYGPTNVPLPKELPAMDAPPSKNPSRRGEPTPSTAALITFTIPGQSAAFQLLTIGDAFAYKAPGAAGYVWAGNGRSFMPVHLLGAVDLDGNGVPEVIFGQQHQEGNTVFGVIELGPKPRVIGQHGEVAY